jgi:hypothetical protein
MYALFKKLSEQPAQYPRRFDTIDSQHIHLHKRQHIFLIRIKHPAPMSATPSNASHIQYGIKQISRIMPIMMMKPAMSLRMRQLPHNTLSPP